MGAAANRRRRRCLLLLCDDGHCRLDVQRPLLGLLRSGAADGPNLEEKVDASVFDTIRELVLVKFLEKFFPDCRQRIRGRQIVDNATAVFDVWAQYGERAVFVLEGTARLGARRVGGKTAVVVAAVTWTCCLNRERHAWVEPAMKTEPHVEASVACWRT